MQASNKQLSVGIIGGMGPEATVLLFNKIVQYTPAEDDVDHLKIVIDNNPKIPSRIKALIDKTGENPVNSMIEVARNLQTMGAELIVMPCNTAHHYHGQINEHVDIPFINMIEVVKKIVLENNKDQQKIGLLASSALQKIGLYESVFTDQEIIYPDNQTDIMEIIKKIKSGVHDASFIDTINEAIVSFVNQGVDVVIIACTELSLIDSSQLSKDVKLIDALDELAKEAVSMANNGKVKIK